MNTKLSQIASATLPYNPATDTVIGVQGGTTDVQYPLSIVRTVLTGNLNLYVNAATGSDSYNGLSATFTGGVNGPKATLQNAWDSSSAIYDLAIYDLNINCAAGTYSLLATNGYIGGRNVNILGAGSASTTIDNIGWGLDALGNAFNFVIGPTVNIDNCTLADNGVIITGSCVFGSAFGLIQVGYGGNTDIILDSTANSGSTQIYSGLIGNSVFVNTCTSVGDFNQCLSAANGGQVGQSGTFTFSGSPTCPSFPTTSGLVVSVNLSYVLLSGSFVGSVAGGAYFVGDGALIIDFTNSPIPASVSGWGVGGGIYDGPDGRFVFPANLALIVADLSTAVITPGTNQIVSDALNPISGQPVVGGGTVTTPVFWNAAASAWIVGSGSIIATAFADLPRPALGLTSTITDGIASAAWSSVVTVGGSNVPTFLWSDGINWRVAAQGVAPTSGVQIDDIGTHASSSSVTTTLTNSSLTIGTGSNLALVATLCYYNSSVLPSSTGIAWDPSGANQALTLISRESIQDGSNYIWCELWGLVAPTSGNKQLIATVPTTQFVTLNGVSFSDVNQTGGSTTFYGAATNSDPSAGSATVGPITVSIGDAAIECSVNNGSTSGPTQTQIYIDNSNSNASSYALISSGSTVTFGWGAINVPWAEVACGILAA